MSAALLGDDIKLQLWSLIIFVTGIIYIYEKLYYFLKKGQVSLCLFVAIT